MKRLAVLGFPVSHSRSPAMQNAALAELGLGDEWGYEAVEVEPARFEERVREMAGEFVGANVTVPHKEAALAVADTPSGAAREIGAANTLVFREGRIEARNTDAGGLLAALPGSPSGQRALVLGAGGAARAAGLCAELGGTAVADPDQGAYELIVNTSAAGLHGEDPFEQLPLRAEGFVAAQTVLDMVYGERPSPLLAAAEAAGATVVDGLEVLVQQGALSLEIWTGRKAPIETMRAAAHRLAS
jgi:shikimate dehydrogenase